MIAIAGAGIAGLALAGALRRAGRPVTIYEERPELAGTGAGITLWPNALAALDALGFGDAVRSIGNPIVAGGIRRPDGRWVRRIDRDRFERALGGRPLDAHRGELIGLLAAGVDTGAIRTGVAVGGFEQHATGVRVRLTDGSVETAEALVGADGYRSAVARHLGRLTERYTGYTAWRGIAQVDTSAVAAFETWAPGREFGFLPMRQDQTYWFAAGNQPEAGHSPGREAEIVSRLFAGWPDPIGTLVAHTPESAIARHDIHDRAVPRAWSAGRVALIGDAAHAMRPHLGQGGCQALTDAAALAAALAATDSPETAFRRYESTRRRAVLRCVRDAALAGRILHGRRIGAATAIAVAAHAPEIVALRYLGTIASKQAGLPHIHPD